MAAKPLVSDFSSCLSFCSRVKRSLFHVFRSLPDKLSFSYDGNMVMFLASASWGGNCLYGVCVYGEDHTWRRLESPEQSSQLSRSEQLLRERMRETSSGITHYTYIPEIGSVLVNAGHQCRLITCALEQLEVE